MIQGDETVDAIANAVLYEGYLLYPYRHTAVKNRVRWTFGGLYPRCWSEATGGSEPWLQQMECLVIGGESCRLQVKVRFLRILECSRGDQPSWQEATEHTVEAADFLLPVLFAEPVTMPFEIAGGSAAEAGTTRRWQTVHGEVEVAAVPLDRDTTRLQLRIRNTTALGVAATVPREQAVLWCLASTHSVLGVGGGEFVSLTNPPERLRQAAQACQNVGVWPVLVGDRRTRDVLLASPIILEDYPQVAAESPVDLFDSSEIDELLTLRILTLTDEEKAEMRSGDERTRRLLDRAEALTPEQLMRLHGTVRSLRPLTGGEE